MSPTFNYIRTVIKSTILVLLLFVAIACTNNTTELEPSFKSVDVAIVNGNVLDGTGKEAFSANIYIKGDSIVYIGEISNPDLEIGETVDAEGKFVSPGFIDLHAHGNPLKTPDFENFLAMGVTSIVLGQDGSSPNVKDLKTYLDLVDAQNLGVNIMEFVGHGTLRRISKIGVKTEITRAAEILLWVLNRLRICTRSLCRRKRIGSPSQNCGRTR